MSAIALGGKKKQRASAKADIPFDSRGFCEKDNPMPW